MAKVIVERPRLGGKYSRPGRSPRSMEDLPRKESMKKKHKDRKTLNENLNPLKRFLKSQVGRPWDDVYSDICENLKVTNTVQQHVRDHIKDFVYTNVEVEGKKVFGTRRYYIARFELRNEDLYICPKTGLLKKYKTKPKKRVPYDEYKTRLARLFAGSFDLVEKDGELYKLFADPHDQDKKIYQIANATEARNDYRNYRYKRQEVISFLAKFQNRINLKHPYWSTYLDLLDKEQEKVTPTPKPFYYEPGSAVEISENGGKTWVEGVVNRVQLGHDDKPSYWVTVGSKNIHISGYIPSRQLRLVREKK